MSKMIVLVSIALVLIVGSIVLQIFLSLRKNKWFGLFIPFLCFIFGIIYSSGMYFYTDISTDNEPIANFSGIIISTILMLIPFFLNLIIYFACRNKLKEKAKTSSEIEKMKIKDL